jgi:hypothetical protein
MAVRKTMTKLCFRKKKLRDRNFLEKVAKVRPHGGTESRNPNESGQQHPNPDHNQDTQNT